MSNLLLFTPDYPPSRGGVARYLFALKSVLGERLDVETCKTIPSHLQLIRRFRKAKHDHQEILVSHICPIGTDAYLCGCPYTLFFHGMDFDLACRNRMRKMLARRIIQKAEHVIANSHALAQEIATFARIPPPLVLYPCVSEELVEASREICVRSSSQTIHLLTVARLVPRKGHERVLRAMKTIPNTTYAIVGDGPHLSYLKDLVSELGLSERVQFFTQVTDEDLPRLYREADIFVMPTISSPTDREGFGIVYLEAGLFELPVIASALPGVQEAVLDAETGFLVRSDEDLANRLFELCNHAELRTRYGKKARERVLRDFTQQKVFEHISSLW